MDPFLPIELAEIYNDKRLGYNLLESLVYYHQSGWVV